MDGRNLKSLAVHALFIGIIFVLPEALLRVAIPERTIDISWPMYAKSLITISVFYLNYFIVVPRTLIQKRRLVQFFVLNLIIIVAGAVAIWVIYRYIYQGPRLHHASSLASMSYILRDSIILLLAGSLAVAIRLSTRWLELEQRQQKLIAARNQSELNSLRSQLNPHFLFNTLNSIYALIAISPDEAQKAVHRLSSLLRYVVYDNPKEVSLDQEITFVENYVELMRYRLGSRPLILNIERHNDEGARIPPLLFVTIVENAFKHGNTVDTNLPIRVDIESDGKTIKCTTVNFFDRAETVDKAPNKHHQGVGIANVQRRISLIYGPEATFDSRIDGNRFTACLQLPNRNI